MADSTLISSTPPQPVTSRIIPQNPTQTLDPNSSYRRPKIDVHASAHKLFDEISQQKEEPLEDFKLTESTMSYEDVEIEDMEWNEELKAYTYPCPCDDLFQITKDELKIGEETATRRLSGSNEEERGQ